MKYLTEIIVFLLVFFRYDLITYYKKIRFGLKKRINFINIENLT